MRIKHPFNYITLHLVNILLLHTDVSVRACTSCRPFVITNKELLLSTVSYRKYLF